MGGKEGLQPVQKTIIDRCVRLVYNEFIITTMRTVWGTPIEKLKQLFGIEIWVGLNQIEIHRGLTTSSTAIFVPFTTQELFQNGKEALYYGINALSNNLIMVRFRSYNIT